VTKRHIHYEAAFEDYLRSRRLPYVAVDETRRALFAEAKLKSLDFIVYAPCGPNLLVDVKGRRFPGSGGRRWENWSTADDVQSLGQWQDVFGHGFRSLLVFVYWLVDGAPAEGFETVHRFRDNVYGLVGIWLDQYRRRARVRSPKWRTVSVPARDFQQAIAPLAWFLK
jgi:hypothetical protein